MNVWIDVMREAMGMGRAGWDFSLSDLSMLVPDTGCLVAIAAVTAFCLVAAWQDAWTSQRQDRRSDAPRRWGRP
jgi:hypothetical protein